MLSKESEKLASIEEELSLARMHKQEIEEFGYCIKKALDIMEDCGRKVKEDIKPLLAKRTSEITECLTNRYINVVTNIDNGGIVIPIEDGKVVPLTYLSSGTIDQIYLALRLAMTDRLSSKNEPLPLILDEVFSQYDDNRLQLAAGCLGNASLDKQIILLTCREHEVKTITNALPEHNLITLG